MLSARQTQNIKAEAKLPAECWQASASNISTTSSVVLMCLVTHAKVDWSVAQYAHAPAQESGVLRTYMCKVAAIWARNRPQVGSMEDSEAAEGHKRGRDVPGQVLASDDVSLGHAPVVQTAGI